MSETSILLHDAATRVFETHIDEAAIRRAETGEWLAAAWEACAEFGAPLMLLSESDGGFGLEANDAFALVRLAGKHAVPLPLAETMIANHLLAKAGLPISQDKPLTIAPQGDVDELTLSQNDAGWHVAGTVKGVPWGRCADLVLVKDGHLLRLDHKLAQVEPSANMADQPRDTVNFDMPLPDGTIAPVKDLAQADVFAAGAAARAAQIAGALDAILPMTTGYSGERVQFGRPLAKFQAVQQNLALLAGECVAAGGAADLGASSFGQLQQGSSQAALGIAAAKSRGGEAAGKAASLAHQIFAAIGFTREHKLNLSTRSLWSWRDEFGSEAHWNRALGEAAIAQGHAGLWPMITETR